MKKIISFMTLVALCAGIWFVGNLISDREKLEQELVRLHVVGASNSEHDQSVKLSVRDAILQSLEQMLDGITDAQQAKSYIQAHLPQIEETANQALKELGETKQAVVSFLKEEFPVRQYDTFALPSGIYDSLRITIGEGEGRNWWCVVFPRMCYSATSSEVKDVTAGAGFSDGLANTITGEYEIRFFFLDVLGKAQNFFHRS